MIKFLKIQNPPERPKSFSRAGNKGMSYVELIVVLAIFAVLSSVVLFNYSKFQAKVDIKNLSSDIALQIVQAQKSSLAGLLPPVVQRTNYTDSTWKPSYGVYFNITAVGGDNKSFIYFTDLNNSSNTPGTQNSVYDTATCPGSGECLNKITITKGNYISGLAVVYQNGTTAALNDLTVVFSRNNPSAIIRSSTAFTSTVSYVRIAITSPVSPTGTIKLYPSGRVQVN